MQSKIVDLSCGGYESAENHFFQQIKESVEEIPSRMSNQRTSFGYAPKRSFGNIGTYGTGALSEKGKLVLKSLNPHHHHDTGLDSKLSPKSGGGRATTAFGSKVTSADTLNSQDNSFNPAKYFFGKKNGNRSASDRDSSYFTSSSRKGTSFAAPRQSYTGLSSLQRAKESNDKNSQTFSLTDRFSELMDPRLSSGGNLVDFSKAYPKDQSGSENPVLARQQRGTLRSLDRAGGNQADGGRKMNCYYPMVKKTTAFDIRNVQSLLNPSDFKLN